MTAFFSERQNVGIRNWARSQLDMPSCTVYCLRLQASAILKGYWTERFTTAGATGGAPRSCKQQIPAKATPFIIMMKSQSNVVQTLVGPGRRALLIVVVCVPALLPLVSGMRALGLTGLLTEGSQDHSSQECRRLDQRCEGYARRKDGFKIAGRQIWHLSRQGRKLQVISVRATTHTHTHTHEHVESSQACPSDCYRDEFHVKATSS